MFRLGLWLTVGVGLVFRLGLRLIVGGRVSV